MLVNYEVKGKKLLVSYINKEGHIKILPLHWPNPQKFEICYDQDTNKHPTYKTWNGKSVKLTPARYPDRYAIYEFLDSQPDNVREIIFEFNEPKIFYIDIETEIPEEGGFVDPRDASTKVLTVAIVIDDKVLLFGLKPLTSENLQNIKDQINDRFKEYGLTFKVGYKSYHNMVEPEKAMLKDLFENYFTKMPVMTGWNFVNYDWTFLVTRCKKLGLNPNVASITKRMNIERDPDDGNEYELPMHRIVIDYMKLCRKWDTKIKVRESMSLDFFATQLLGIPKIQYTGSLQDLYRNDYVHYLFYNAVDTILVQEIHRKTKYINIPFAISTLAQIQVLDSFRELRITEGILRKELREKRNIILCRDESLTKQEPIVGGLVLEPRKLGLSKWVACYDFASLYPTTMRQNNIGPEKFKGVVQKNRNETIDNWSNLDKDESPKTCIFEGKEIPLSQTDIVCKNGAVFEAGESVTVDRLTEIYNSRKKYKQSMIEKKVKLTELKKELDELKIMVPK